MEINDNPYFDKDVEKDVSIEKENKWVRLNVSKKGLKTIEKLGIEAVLKKLGK